MSLGAQVMKGDKEIVGTLKGFDDYVNMVLEDVTELCAAPLPSVSLALARSVAAAAAASAWASASAAVSIARWSVLRWLSLALNTRGRCAPAARSRLKGSG